MDRVTLLINDSPCSNETLLVLKGKDIPYEILPSSAPEVPCVRYKGDSFCGIGEIGLLVDGLLQIRNKPSK